MPLHLHLYHFMYPMLKQFFTIAGFCFSVSLQGQFSKGTDLLRQMHKKYYQAGCKCYSFSQKNSHYRNDTLIGNSEWHEVVEYPDKFKIVIGEKSQENYRL